MKLCNNCHQQCAPGSDSFAGSVVYPGIYMLVFTHACGGTYGCVLHEVPEDVTFIDGDPRETTNSLSDLRSEEAA